MEEQVDDVETKSSYEDLRNADVVTKYQEASKIAQGAYLKVKAACVPGVTVSSMCVLGDQHITDECDKIYKSKGQKEKLQKGIGFPTCISINHIVGSFSPSPSEVVSTVKAGDVVKVDLGCHVDGYVALVADTFVVAPEGPTTGRKADVMKAVMTAAEVAIRLLKPGTKNTAITEAIDKVAKAFNVRTVEGVYSHQMKRFEIDGEKVVANNIPEVPLTGDQKTKEYEMEAHEVWGLDIVMSTGPGKPHQMDERSTNVYKRRLEQSYKLKMKAARAVLSEIQSKHPTFPFATRNLEADEAKVRFGVVNCVQHQLLEPYPVLYEKDGEFVAHVKFTVLLLPNGPLKTTGGDWDTSNLQSECKLTDQALLDLLAQPQSAAKRKKKKANKKKVATTSSAAAAAADEDDETANN